MPRLQLSLVFLHPYPRKALFGFDIDSNGDPAGGWVKKEGFANNRISATTGGLGLAYDAIDVYAVGEFLFSYIDHPGVANKAKYLWEWDGKYDSHE